MSIGQITALRDVRRIRLDRAMEALRVAAEHEARCRRQVDAARTALEAEIDAREAFQRERGRRMATIGPARQFLLWEQRAGLMAERVVRARVRLSEAEKPLATAVLQRQQALADWQAAQRRLDALDQLQQRERGRVLRHEIRQEDNAVEERSSGQPYGPPDASTVEKIR